MVTIFCFFQKKCAIFVMLCIWCGHYILKVFSLSYKKMWKFSRTKDERMTLTTCLFMAESTLIFSIFHPHIIQVWGLVSFIFVRGFPQPSCNKREQASHFLFCIYP